MSPEPIEDTEVDFNDAKDDATPTATAPAEGQQEEKEAPETLVEVVDQIQPRLAPRTQTLGPDAELGPYVQRELSVLARMQWFALVGEVMDRAMSGENALTIGHLFEAPQGARDGNFSVQEFREADTFVKALSKLVRYSADFMEESFIIWLDVPDFDQTKFKLYMKLNEEEGGISEDEIVETFIDQNWAAIDRFFRERLVQVRKRIEARSNPTTVESSRSSTRSSSTPRTTAATR
jgi:hypothetical protein